VKKFCKSVRIWQNYGHESVTPFFGPPCSYQTSVDRCSHANWRHQQLTERWSRAKAWTLLRGMCIWSIILWVVCCGHRKYLFVREFYSGHVSSWVPFQPLFWGLYASSLYSFLKNGNLWNPVLHKVVWQHMHFTANLLENHPVKKSLKTVKIWQNMSMTLVCSFWPTRYYNEIWVSLK